MLLRMLHLVEFFLHHGYVIAFDTDRALNSFFVSTIVNSYHNQGLPVGIQFPVMD